MAVEGFLQANFWYLAGAVFVIGTLLLLKTKFQRYFIIFLIRTQHGIRFLDRLGSLSPSLWKFLADLSVIISFGGLGAVYVSRYRNMVAPLAVLGVIAVIFLFPLIGQLNAAGLFLILLGILFPLQKSRSTHRPKAYFILGSLIIFGIIFSVISASNPPISSYTIGIITGVFGIPGLLVSFLAVHAGQILFQSSTLPGVSPLLPGLSQAGELGFFFPGLDIFIPLWSGLIAIIILLVSHEFSHGILARVQGMKVNSMGLLTFGILPIGAFVEPDEKLLEGRKSEEKMRVYTMGSFANLVVAMLAAILTVALSLQTAAMVEAGGVEIASVQKGLPAEVFSSGTVIQSVNGVPVTSLEAYLNESRKIAPGGNMTLVTDKGEYTLVSVPNPQNASLAYLGFNLRTHATLKKSLAGQELLFGVLIWLISTLGIIFFFNLNVAIVNLLPVLPFDGYKMFEELMKSFRIPPAARKKVTNAVVLLVIVLLVLNALPLGNIISGIFTG